MAFSAVPAALSDAGFTAAPGFEGAWPFAAAFAESGRFPDAVKTAESAADLAKAEGNSGLADSILSQAERYRANLPMRDYRFRSTR